MLIDVINREVRSRWSLLIDWVERPSERKLLALGFLLGVVTHGAFALLAVVFGWGYFSIDEAAVGFMLAEGKGYCWDYYGLFGEGCVEGAFFPPAYVYNTFILKKVFGTSYALLVQNLILTLAIPYALFVFARGLFSQRIARVAFLASMLYPAFFTRINHGTPAYFKMFFMVLLLAALQHLWIKGRGAFIAGIAGGALMLSMPDAQVLLALFSLAFLSRASALSVSARWKSVALLIVGAGLVVAPWTVRNWIRFDALCLVSSNGGFNFYMGHNPTTRGEVDYAVIQDLDRRLGGELAREDEFGRDRILYREGLRYIWENKLRSIGNVLERGLLHWFYRPENLRALGALGRTSEFPLSFQVYIWTYTLTYVPLLVFAVLGLARLRSRWGELAPLLLVCVYSTLIAGAFIVQTKMRLVKAEPVLILFAAAHLAGPARRDPESTATEIIPRGTSSS